MIKTLIIHSKSDYLRLLHYIDNNKDFQRISATMDDWNAIFTIEYNSSYTIRLDNYKNIIVEE